MENLDLKKISIEEAVKLTKTYRESRGKKFSKSFFIPLNVLEKFLVVPEVKGIHIYIGEGIIKPNKENENCLILVPTKFRELTKDEKSEKGALFGSEDSEEQYGSVATEDILFFNYSVNGGAQSDRVETAYIAGPHPPPPTTGNILNS